MSHKQHTCHAVTVGCIDFRFQDAMNRWIFENLGEKNSDSIRWAGASKNLPVVIDQLDISVRLHKIKEVVLIHHEECGAYGSESTPENHTRDLQKAKVEILAKYPDLEVSLYYLHLDGTFENVV